MNNIVVLYHANCADGFGAAYAAWVALGNTAEYRPVKYGSPPPADLTGKHILLVDFSYDRETLICLAETATSVLVIDHHASAISELTAGTSTFRHAAVSWSRHQELVSGVDHPLYCDKYLKEGVHTILTDARSGAWLTWDFFHPTTPTANGDGTLTYASTIPKLIQHIDDRDRWQFQMPHTREIMASLMAHPFDFEIWRNFAEDLEESSSRAIDEGTAILRAHDRIVEQIAAEAMMMTIGGFRVPVANAPHMYASDVAGLLSIDYPFAATYHDTGSGRIFSLRRRHGDLDLSHIAKQYHGGGHTGAAGFTRPLGWSGDLLGGVSSTISGV